LLHPSPVYLEVDRPETQEFKRERLGDILSTVVRYVPCDFETECLSASLENAGYSRERPCFFLWEGVTNYLDAKAVDKVLDTVSASAPGSLLLFTYVDRSVLDDPNRFVGSHRLRSTLRKSGESWTFGLDPCKVARFLDHRGLRLVSDMGSLDYRARYLGSKGPHLRGYEFYRAAVATVAGTASPFGRREGANECPR
jgi:methyltransferase (TIGR00027 family)